jgi:hypothetical protein
MVVPDLRGGVHMIDMMKAFIAGVAVGYLVVVFAELWRR